MLRSPRDTWPYRCSAEKNSNLFIPREGKQFNGARAELIGKVKWEETGTGIRPRIVEHFIYCQPERRIPILSCSTKAKAKSWNWHPFWHVRRSCISSEINCDVVQVEITNITSSPMEELTKGLTDDDKDRFTPTTIKTSFTVTLPFIVNKARIEVGKELVVYMEKKSEGKKVKAKKRAITAYNRQPSSSSKIQKR